MPAIILFCCSLFWLWYQIALLMHPLCASIYTHKCMHTNAETQMHTYKCRDRKIGNYGGGGCRDQHMKEQRRKDQEPLSYLSFIQPKEHAQRSPVSSGQVHTLLMAHKSLLQALPQPFSLYCSFGGGPQVEAWHTSRLLRILPLMNEPLSCNKCVSL